jgi:prepilin-type N-terminal cleavage/methylation domain-containing protein
MSPKDMRRNEGFTLTELLVVAAISVAVMSVGVANIWARAPYYRMEDVRWRIISDLRAARASAVMRGQSISVTFNGTTDQYLIWTDANRNNVEDSGEKVTKSLPAYGGMTMTCSPATGTFSSMGTWTCANSYEQITFTIPGAGTATVVITPSGEVDSDL